MNAYGMEAPTIELLFKKTPKPKAITKKELDIYVGEYQLPNAVVKVYIRNENTLFVEVPGQPPYELTPVNNHKFAFKILSGYSVQFDVKEGEKPSALSFIQPNGTFKATRK